jgi:hypothetical protein
MHQPVDYDDTRFYAADILLILKSDATCGVLGALCAARTGAGALLAGDDHMHHSAAHVAPFTGSTTVATKRTRRATR